jgi:DNA-directed RNA polymerase sigma subunit (sigma70/sigma32)
MRSFLWPSEDGWPYPDDDGELVDPAAGIDEDLVSVRILSDRALDDLEPLERLLIGARFGVGGQEIRSMKQLHADTGLSRSDLRASLGSGLTKLRAQLA